MSYKCLHRLLLLIGFVLTFSIAYSQDQYVYDHARVLAPDQVDSLKRFCNSIEKESSSQVVVYITNDISKDTPIEDYSLKIAQGLGIGHDKTDNGVLILICPEIRRSRIEVGYGLEGILTDALTSSIQRNEFNPYFKSQNYFSGICSGLIKIKAAIHPEAKEIKTETLSTPTDDGMDIGTFYGLVIVGVILIIGVIITIIRGKMDANEELSVFLNYVRRVRYFLTAAGEFEKANSFISKVTEIEAETLSLCKAAMWWNFGTILYDAEMDIDKIYLPIKNKYDQIHNPEPVFKNSSNTLKKKIQQKIDNKRRKEDDNDDSFLNTAIIASTFSSRDNFSDNSSSSDNSPDTSFDGGDFGGGGSSSDW